jgi:serine/threonine-protein kinase RsbW
MERRFKRSVNALEKVFAFIGEFFDAEQIDGSHLYAINFSVEELFTNMLKYNVGASRDILVGLRKLDDRLEVRLTDFDVDPFDITKTEEIDVSRPLDEREPGGLGIHLVKKMVDRIEYEYVDRRSTTTVIKMLG